VLGVDASRHMIDFAAAAFPAAAHPNLRFAVADAAALALPAAFDLAVSFNALHWVRDLAAPLRGLRAALVAGGRASLRFVPAGSRRSLEDVIEDTCGDPAWRQWFAGHRPPFVHPAADQYAGRAEVVRETWEFASRADFSSFASATFVAWTERLPPERRADFIADVLDRYAAVLPPPPSPHAFVFDQLEIGRRRRGLRSAPGRATRGTARRRRRRVCG
jgi:trans-aconitate 2-methyltransferase